MAATHASTQPSPPASPSGPSVDPREVAQFEAMGAQWWSETGPMKALHRMNPVRVRWLRDAMAEHFPAPEGALRDVTRPGALEGLTILDIGCGGGILSEPLARLGGAVTGIDPAQANLDIARAHAQATGVELTYRAVTAEALAQEGALFDVVCAMEVVEHVRRPADFVATAGRLVRPGGLLFLSTLNRTLKSFALAIVGAEYVLRWVPPGTHQWEKFITPRELRLMVEDAGLDQRDASGMIYNPLTREWRTSSDMDVNFMIVAEKLQ